MRASSYIAGSNGSPSNVVAIVYGSENIASTAPAGA